MLSDEQKFFLTALSDYVHGRKTVVPDGLDEAALVSVSGQQQTDSVLYFQTHLPALRPAFASVTYHVVNSRRLQQQLHTALTGAGVPYLIFKGTEIAAYYSRPELRSMGDLDLLVHRADKEKAGDILCRMGFERAAEGPEDHEWAYFKRELEIELHHRLLYQDDMNEAGHVAFTDRVWEYAATEDGVRYHLEPEFHFVYLLLHLRKHLLWAGIGVRQFLDLALMMKNAALRWERVEETLSDLELLPFARTCFAFIERWFDIRCPIAPEQIPDGFFLSATETILSGGVFGRLDKENLVDHDVMNTTRKHGKLLPTLSVLFPPYRQMKEKYPVMGKCPLLLPVMWVRRMLEAVFHGTAKEGLDYAAKHLVKSDAIRDREAMLKNWGL